MYAVAFVVAALGLSIGCNSDDDVTGNPTGGGSNLTVVNATPSDGDGTITVAGSFIVNNGGTGFDELNFSQMTGSVGHDITITWDTTTHALHSAQHGWGAGFTQCVMGTANACDPSKITIDVSGHTVTFTGLVLVDDTFGTSATSTLTGAGHW
jgi:hypothetical protein